MDGTIYRGQTLFPSTLPFLDLLRRLEVGHTFLTNNSSRSVRDYLGHLGQFGIQAEAYQLYTSTQATIRFLRQTYPQAKRLFVLGTPSLFTELIEHGFALTKESPSDEPDVVIVGFDTSLVYPRLCRAAYWIERGKPFIATHPDRFCPTSEPTVLVDCGSICAALEKATGRAPDAILGKPDVSMLSGILDRHRLAADELAMVGDRLYTDMIMARRIGALGVLVLTGETTAAEAQAAEASVDLVVPDLHAFGEFLHTSQLSPAAN
jgi:NagD protein